MSEGIKFEKGPEQEIPSVFDSLKEAGMVVETDPFGERNAYAVKSHSENALTTMRIALNDYSGADLVITNMTTLPDESKGRGLGSEALQKLITWAHENNLSLIRAVQVQRASESFWQKNGFERIANPNPTNDFIYTQV